MARYLNRAYQGPCREKPCSRHAQSPTGYCQPHYMMRIIQGKRPGERPRAFQGPCRVYGCPARCSGAHGFCVSHVKRPDRYNLVGEVARQNWVYLTTIRLKVARGDHRLNEYQSWVADMHLLEGLSQSRIGALLGVSRERGRVLVNEVMKQLAEI